MATELRRIRNIVEAALSQTGAHFMFALSFAVTFFFCFFFFAGASVKPLGFD